VTEKHSSDVHRLLAIMGLVQGELPVTLETLKREFGVGERTIFRDLAKLKSSGVEIYFDRKLKRFVMAANCLMQPLQLTGEEAIALTALCNQIAGSDQIAFTRPAYQAMQKIRAQLPEAVRSEADAAASHVRIQTERSATADGHADVYDRMREAIATRTAVECEYETPGRLSRGVFEFHPYTLFFGVRAWYAVGLHGRYGEVRMLKLGRFSRVSATPRRYDIPEKFSLERFLGNAWRMIKGQTDHEVELLFSPPFAETIAETNWHRTQEIEEHANGTTTFRCTVSGLDEIKWWVLGMGPACTVIGPAELRTEVERLAAETAAIYARAAEAERTGSGTSGGRRPAKRKAPRG